MSNIFITSLRNEDQAINRPRSFPTVEIQSSSSSINKEDSRILNLSDGHFNTKIVNLHLNIEH